MPVSNVPATILPRVTGSRFQNSAWPTEIGAPSIMPEGIRNMLTTECSKPSAKNVMMGSHMAAIFPTVDFEDIASTAPIVTIQLKRMAFALDVPLPLGGGAMEVEFFLEVTCLGG